MIIYSLFFSFCSFQTASDKQLIKNFVNKYVVNNNLSIEGLDEYITFSDFSKKMKLEEAVLYLLKEQQKELKNCDNFEILSYKEFIDSGITQNSKIEFSPFNYKNIYFLVIDSKEIGFYIVKNHKIISIFPEYIRKSKTDIIYPYFLNDTYEKITIKKFIRRFIERQNNSYNGIEHYVNINESKNESYMVLINKFVEYYKKDIQSVGNYQILKHDELDIIISPKDKVVYNNYNNVFYLIADDEVKMFFIFEDKKIISFFGNITKVKNGKIYPFILSQ